MNRLLLTDFTRKPLYFFLELWSLEYRIILNIYIYIRLIHSLTCTQVHNAIMQFHRSKTRVEGWRREDNVFIISNTTLCQIDWHKKEPNLRDQIFTHCWYMSCELTHNTITASFSVAPLRGKRNLSVFLKFRIQTYTY